MKPLAERMRPFVFADVVGQKEAISFLEKVLPDVPSLLLWGPPGSGKTTLARVIAVQSGLAIETLSAVSDGLPALRKVLAKSEKEPLLLFVDEIHRWNKAQQDALLPYVENGQIVLLGATTENPSFEVNPALRSRMQLLKLEALSDDDILTLARKAQERFSFQLEEEAKEDLLLYAAGDGRRALNLLDRALLLQEEIKENKTISQENLRLASGERMANYSKGEERNNIISAWIKSMRAKDPEGALYFLARMEAGGEDVKFIARRLLIFASEDIGLADSGALPIANGALQAVLFVGEPECWINLAHATVYMTQASRSWAAYRSWMRARALVSWKKEANPIGGIKRDDYLHPADSDEALESFLPEDLRGQIWGES